MSFSFPDVYATFIKYHKVTGEDRETITRIKANSGCIFKRTWRVSKQCSYGLQFSVVSVVTSSTCIDLSCRDDDSHLIERVASEFNQLQFYVTQSQGHPLVESIRGVSYSLLHLFLCFRLLYFNLVLSCIKFSYYFILFLS